MIIDVHNHIWPDKIAEKIDEFHHKRSDGIKPAGPCTLSGLLKNMDDHEVDKCVVVDVALKPEQVESINNWLMSIESERIIPFGAMHPDYLDYKKEIERLKDGGIRGVKFQSTWQKCFVDDDRMLRIYEALGDDMIVFLHAGTSPSKKSREIEAAPKRIAHVLEIFPNLKIIAAHFGGNFMLEESKIHLVGKDIYFDTSLPPGLEERMNYKTATEIIEAHGIKNILFGTDYPLSNKGSDIKYIKKLPLSNEAKERILWKNAAELLKL